MARRGDGIYERGDKNWWMDIWINGVRYQKHLGKGIPRRVALDLSRIQRAAILKGDAGINKKPKDLSFRDARAKFETWAEQEKRPTTMRGYRQCLDQLERAFGEKRLSDLTPWTLEQYKRTRAAGTELGGRPEGVTEAEWNRRCRQAKHGAPVRVNRELAVLKTLYNKCVEWRLYEGKNPVCEVKFRPEEKVRLRWLEPEEEQALMQHLSLPMRGLVTVAINCGLRVQAEALTLTWSSVDLKRGTLTIESCYSKNRKMQSLPLNSVALCALRALKATATNEYVFVNEHGQPYRTIRPNFRRACKRAGLTGVTPHTLRHTFASRLVMAGVDLRTIQELGGWRTIGMVERYSHLSPAHKAQAVERIVSKTPSEPDKAVLVAAG